MDISFRTAKLSAWSKIESLMDTDGNCTDQFEDEPSEDGEDEMSEEDDEYGDKTKKRPNKEPPKKQLKLGNTKRTIRGRRNLSVLPTLSMDVIFQIFGFLHPKDLLSLSRTTKIFRDKLLSRNAMSIWKRTFKDNCVAECPNDMTEPKWAALLFGNTCQVCDAKNIQKVDFYLRRRVCTKCKKENLVAEMKFKTEYPEVEKSILDLIPHTNVGGWAHGHTSSTRFFWAADIDAMVKKLAEYQHDIHMRRTNARQNLDDYVSQRKEFVKYVISHVEEHQRQLTDIVKERETTGDNARNARQDAIRQRFVELGYAKEDADNCDNHVEFNRRSNLSERVWTRIRPLLEPLVQEGKARRLETEEVKLKERRRKIVDGLYTAYKRTIRPLQWPHLPHTYEVCLFRPFSQIIDLPGDVLVTAEHFENAMRMLPNLISQRWDEKRNLRLKMMPASLVNAGSPSVDVLQSAHAVFLCRNGHYNGTIIIGTEEHKSHSCMKPCRGLPESFLYHNPNDDNDCLSFSPEGSELVRTLMGLAGLNVDSTTASEMDKHDLWFSCSDCHTHHIDGQWMRFGYSWRAAIHHTRRDHRSGLWTILAVTDPVLIKQAKDSENESKHSKAHWACSRCPQNLNNLQDRAVVADHLRDAHQIPVPKEPDDLFFYDRAQSVPGRVRFPTEPPPKPVKPKPLLMPNDGRFNCNYCANGSVSEAARVFNPQGIMSHIRDKHKIHPDNIKEGMSYKRL